MRAFAHNLSNVYVISNYLDNIAWKESMEEAKEITMEEELVLLTCQSLIILCDVSKTSGFDIKM
jgi:hypothetical protein